MKECAFCPSTARLSAEHIISGWMDDLFHGPMTAKIQDSSGFTREWESESGALDYTARVVCQECNNTWMSDIEGLHAKPVMTPLIKGDTPLPIGGAEAHSLALFAFKVTRGRSPRFGSNVVIELRDFPSGSEQRELSLLTLRGKSFRFRGAILPWTSASPVSTKSCARSLRQPFAGWCVPLHDSSYRGSSDPEP
jgi:hypothetical protein